MELRADQLESALRRRLAPVYLVAGDEPLLVDEAVRAIVAAARAAGFGGRELVAVESGFDWNDFFAGLQTGSLFAEKRLIELRLPTGRPGEAGAKVLAELARAAAPELLLIVRAGRLERSVRAAKWVKAIEDAGAVVTIYPLDAARLPGWIAQRLRAAGLQPGAGVAERLAWHIEGNLLAGVQEIEKLALLFGARAISVDDIEGVLGDNARYSVYALADACLGGDARAVRRILGRLHAEGEAPALVLWALARELRMLAGLAAEVGAGRPLEQVLDAHRDLVWAKRRALVAQALKRAGTAEWRRLLSEAAQADRVVKGRAAGEPWQALECLALAMGGLRLASCA